jgi:hypothetical protein
MTPHLRHHHLLLLCLQSQNYLVLEFLQHLGMDLSYLRHLHLILQLRHCYLLHRLLKILHWQNLNFVH